MGVVRESWLEKGRRGESLVEKLGSFGGVGYDTFASRRVRHSICLGLLLNLDPIKRSIWGLESCPRWRDGVYIGYTTAPKPAEITTSIKLD